MKQQLKYFRSNKKTCITAPNISIVSPHIKPFGTKTPSSPGSTQVYLKAGIEETLQMPLGRKLHNGTQAHGLGGLCQTGVMQDVVWIFPPVLIISCGFSIAQGSSNLKKITKLKGRGYIKAHIRGKPLGLITHFPFEQNNLFWGRTESSCCCPMRATVLVNPA